MKLLDTDTLYKKYPKIKREDVDKIKDWIEKQPHLPKLTDLEISWFLYGTNYSVEAAKQRLDNYFTFRTHVPLIFKDRDILGEDMLFMRENMSFQVLPQRTPEGHKILLSKLTDSDPFKYHYEKFIRLSFFAGELELFENGPEGSVIIVADLQGATLSHLARVNLTLLKQANFFMSDCYPGEIIQFHFINTVSFMDRIMGLMKQFLKSDFLQKIHIHSSVSDLDKFFPIKLLPKNYPGGEQEDVDVLWNKYWDYLVENRDHFLTYGNTKLVNEKLRPKKSNMVDDIFGVEGNFKKLDLD